MSIEDNEIAAEGITSILGILKSNKSLKVMDLSMISKNIIGYNMINQAGADTILGGINQNQTIVSFKINSMEHHYIRYYGN